jgi:hypothetical protein
MVVSLCLRGAMKSVIVFIMSRYELIALSCNAWMSRTTAVHRSRTAVERLSNNRDRSRAIHDCLLLFALLCKTTKPGSGDELSLCTQDVVLQNVSSLLCCVYELSDTSITTATTSDQVAQGHGPIATISQRQIWNVQTKSIINGRFNYLVQIFAMLCMETSRAAYCPGETK